MCSLSFEEILNRIDVWEDWQADYKRMVPRFIKEALTKTDWKDWDRDVFKMFFEQRGGHCVASLQQGYFTKDEMSGIKIHWAELAPMLRTVAENQDEPQWDVYFKIKDFIRKFTKQDRRSATNRLVASLQPELLCTVVQEGHLWDLYHNMQEFGCRLPEYEGGNWFRNSHAILQFFKKHVPHKDIYDIITLPWQVKVYFNENKNLMQQKQETMDSYIRLLKENRNVIFNGAPGTGKTYLARQLAARMIYGSDVPDNFEDDDCFKQHCAFVQFHPSYDYTDFVEGLRPTAPDKNGNIGFERKDGVFKKFCAGAIYRTCAGGTTFGVLYESIVNDIKSGKITEYYNNGKSYPLRVNDKGRIEYRDTDRSPRALKEDNIRLMFEKFVAENKYDLSSLGRHDYWEMISSLTEGRTSTVDYVEYGWILQNLLDRAKRRMGMPDTKPEVFVFIIDEINRGEISKIFGELFFSIDPGYRGRRGKVCTQYQNMIADDGDPFKDGFYVPENVYIIGTMNDIDRSVESMDFAMRRRFAFHEITAEESAANMNLDDNAKMCMMRLNEAISATDGLDSSYHVGASYFVNVKDYGALWKLKLKGLLKEYLRGMADAEECLRKLEHAYYGNI